MKLKTYYSDTVEAAMRIAKVELGHEAVLVGSRASSGDASKGLLQVTFATPPTGGGGEQVPKQPSPAPHWKKFVPRELSEPPASAGGLPAGDPVEQQQPAGAEDPVNRRIDDLAAQVGELRMLFVSESTPAQTGEGPSKEAGTLFGALVNAGVESGIAKRLVNRPPLIPGIGLKEASNELRRRLLRLWNVDAELLPEKGGRRAVALIGPCGAGKTTSLARLAVRYGLEQRRRIAFVCVDPLRVGSVEALEEYARIFGATLRVVDEPEQMPAALQEISKARPAAELVLVDTPGYAPAESERLRRLSEALKECVAAAGDFEFHSHLVLSAATANGALRAAVGRYGVCAASRLLFTHLDESGRPGSVLNEAVRTGLPLSFVGSGPRLPQDLQPASAKVMTELLLADFAQARGV